MSENRGSPDLPQAQYRPRGNPWVRPNAIVQIAVQLWQASTAGNAPYPDIRMLLGAVESGVYQAPVKFGFEGPDIVLAVGRGELDLGTLNPSALLTMAYRGVGPFDEPLPVRAIAIMPSFDLMGFALAQGTGCTSLAEVRERRVPLRVSLRDDPSHTPLIAVDQVLGAEGFSLADIEAWGGVVQYVANTPSHPDRLRGMRSGTIDAVFDEGIGTWGGVALEAGFRFAQLQDSTLARMETIGWPLLSLRERFPDLPQDLMTISFSGWPLYTHADLPEETGYRIAEALYRARDA